MNAFVKNGPNVVLVLHGWFDSIEESLSPYVLKPRCLTQDIVYSVFKSS